MPKIDVPSQAEIEEPAESRLPSKKKKRGRPILVLVVVVVVIVAAGFLITRFTGGEGLVTLKSGGKYQAVFLINGQVYFGHVVKETSDLIVLRDIYYLRATEPLQQGEGTAGQRGSELSLIKLGNELHGPKDEMRIVRNNVLFIENLKDDSKVTTAIEEYVASQKED